MDLTMKMPNSSTQNKQEKNDAILWLSVTEAAKISGVQNKTIRRAIKSNEVKYRIRKNRYEIEFLSLMYLLNSKTKLRNKFNLYGLGKYIKEWKNLEI